MQPIHSVKSKTYANLPEKVFQIGEGNFLRAFADFAIDIANEKGLFGGSVVMCQPRGNSAVQKFNDCSCIYNVLTRGIKDGKTVDTARTITSISRCISPYDSFDEFLEVSKNPNLKVIISNTTEAGIAYSDSDDLYDAPPTTYPAKLTLFLYHRYKHFSGDSTKGLLILPLELIENNGDALRLTVFRYATKWDLEVGFTDWLSSYCCFASSLVDRIVTGYPYDEEYFISSRLGYSDKLMVACEPYMFWAIKADGNWSKEFPVDKLGLNIIYTEDIDLYRKRKVRILNGAHTVSVLSAFLSGLDTVLEMMNDKTFLLFIKKALYDEIIPTLDMPKQDLEPFANAVLERFSNPFIKHKLLDISLNSVSKFKARVLPSMLDYINKYNAIPDCLSLGLASLIRFYDCTKTQDEYQGTRLDGERYTVRDDAYVLEFMSQAHKSPDSVVHAVLSNTSLWGQDLTQISALEEKVALMYNSICGNKIKAAIQEAAKL